MTKPIEEMTREEIAEERAEIARQRAALAAMSDSDLEKAVADLPDDGYTDGPGEVPLEDTYSHDDHIEKAWPYEHLTLDDLVLEVRTPDESALVAVSMAGMLKDQPQVQMRIFTQFVVHHLSAESFALFTERMVDPESKISIQALIQAMAEMPR